jgi:hypothetical protein
MMLNRFIVLRVSHRVSPDPRGARSTAGDGGYGVMHQVKMPAKVDPCIT